MLYYISKFLWQLLVTGFPPECEHQYSKWELYKERPYETHDGKYIEFTQKCVCSKCNHLQFRQIDTPRLGRPQ